MSLSKKYNISADAVNKMVKDGVISCSWPAYEDIYNYYKQILPKHKSKVDAVSQVCDDKHVGRTLVYKCISLFE